MVATLEAIEKSDVTNKLNEFNNAFNNLISDSNEPHQQQFNDKRNALRVALKSENFRGFPNTWRTALEELGLYELIGAQLQQRIKHLIDNNQLTPVVARDEIKRLTDKLAEYQAQFRKIDEAFGYLGLGLAKPHPGEGVLSVLMPRKHYQSELAQFAEEIESLSEMAGWLSELVTGRTEMPKVKELSTTEPWMLISLGLGTVFAFLKIVEKMQNIRINTYKLKQFRVQAEQLDTSPAVKSAIQDNVNEIVDKCLKEIYEWLFSTYKKAGSSRLNELRSPMEKKLAWFANCLDHGYQIDGDAGELEEESDLSGAKKKQYSATVKRIKDISLTIKYLETPSEPVLMLATPKRRTKQETKSTQIKSDKKATAMKPSVGGKSK